MAENQIYTFGGFRLDSLRRLLFGPDGEPIALKPKVFETLLCLVEHAGTVLSKTELMEAVWGDRVVEENSLSKHISTLRHVFGEAPGEHRFIVTEPGHGYRFVAAVRARDRIEAEATEALGELADAMQTPIEPASVWRKWNYSLVGFTCALLLAGVWWRESIEVPSTDSDTIAVLAFSDLSPGRNEEIIAEGMTIDLTTLLGKAPSLRVTVPNSALSFRGSDVSYAEIGETLGVEYLLDGTVRIIGDQMRVTASLVEASTGVLLWSYPGESRSISDIYAIQNEIAAAVGGQLGAEAGLIVSEDEASTEVYSLYNYAEYIHRLGQTTNAPLRRAIMERAVAMDPNFVPARFQLALAYRSLGMTGALERSEANRLAQRTIDEAESISPDHIEIKLYRITVAFDNGDLATAARYIERALAQDSSNLWALAAAQYLLVQLNRQEESVALGEQIVARDPVCAICFATLLRGYFELERFDEAVAAGRRARALGLELAAVWYGAALLLSGDAEAALAHFQAVPDTGARLAGSVMAFNALGRTAESEDALTEFESLENGAPALLLALISSQVGNREAAFESLGRLRFLPPDVLANPLLRPLRADTRWKDLERKAGIFPRDPRDEIVFNPDPFD